MEPTFDGGTIKWLPKETRMERENRNEISRANPLASLARIFRRMGSIGVFAIRRLGLFLSIIWKRFEGVIPKSEQPLRARLLAKLRQWEDLMVGPIEKGIQAAAIEKPKEGLYDGVDLRTLPKYICFRAALLQNKLTLQYIILILSAALLVLFIVSRQEVYSLYGKLRQKEYILAPGVMDFTPASPQSVPDSYVANAVVDFLGQLGNVTAGNIEEQYTSLADFMSPQLKVKFLAEAAGWKHKVKTDGISELLTIREKQIRTTGDGYYRVVALARRDTYINNEYLGNSDEAVEMVLQLVPPKSGKRWYLQIDSLSRQSADSFRKKREME